ncbi:carbohydrate porin [Bradyrhizobium sp. 4]
MLSISTPGLELVGLRANRPDDKFGIAAGYAHVSERAQRSN